MPLTPPCATGKNSDGSLPLFWLPSVMRMSKRWLYTVASCERSKKPYMPGVSVMAWAMPAPMGVAAPFSRGKCAPRLVAASAVVTFAEVIVTMADPGGRGMKVLAEGELRGTRGGSGRP